MYVLTDHQPTLFGTKVYVNDYFLLAGLSPQVAEEIRNYKKKLSHLIGLYEAVDSIPHISLLRFLCIAEQEDKLIRQLKTVIQCQGKLHLQFHRFNQFDGSRTLFVDILDKEPLIELHRQLSLYLKLNMKGVKLAKMNFNPHLTIGKKLSPYQFPLAIEVFAHEPYDRKFSCTHLTLLRRSFDYRNEREYWMKVMDIPLGPASRLTLGEVASITDKINDPFLFN